MGTIKHIYKAYLFLACNQISENNGIIVTNHRNVKKEGENLTNSENNEITTSTLGMFSRR